MNRVYKRLAWTNLKNNRQLQMPYVIIGIVIVAMFYTMLAFVYNPTIRDNVRGGGDVAFVLMLGSFVIGIFSAVFLFYTNSFLMKRRKKELGIYNILGMEKRHIAKVLFWESLILSGITIIGGIVFGMLFQRLLMLVLFKLIGTEAVVKFHISGWAIFITVVLFVVIYLATYIYNLLQVKLANPIALLHGSSVGEKEPKAKPVMAGIGIVCLLAGYYMALRVANVISAVNVFFRAVILVIIGTYCLFIAGSIVLLKGLRKNQKFYYHSKRFVAVSGMLYRMKQNAVGLANICILSTMILLIISTTVSTYIGMKEDLKYAYEAEFNVSAYFNATPADAKEKGRELEKQFCDALTAQGRKIIKRNGYDYFGAFAEKGETGFVFHESIMQGYVSRDVNQEMYVYFMTRESLEERSGIVLEEIPENEVVLIGGEKQQTNTVSLFGVDYVVADSLKFLSDEHDHMMEFMEDIYYCVVEDNEMLHELHEKKMSFFKESFPEYNYEWYIDIDGNREEKLEAYETMWEIVRQYTGSDDFFRAITVVSRQEQYESFLQINGGLLFLGIFLGTMFLMAMVMIIYYKQISEGYEDRERFQIMGKVGMSDDEARQTIHTQIRMVFFLPLVTAVIHVAVSFPMMKYLLAILNLYNTKVFVCCIIGTVCVFGAIYYIVFRITSKSYYRIVGNQAG